MFLWIICAIFGVISLLSIPALLGLTIKILTKIGRKFPKLADIAAIFSVLLLVIASVFFIAIMAYGFHHIISRL
jgi:hypothetical protein